MEAIILVGIQASGKTTFCKERFFNTHVRINLDMLRTRHRERLFLSTCIESQMRFVVDNTNPTVEERAKYIEPAKQAGYRIVGYFFDSPVSDSLRRNALRIGEECIPEVGVLGTYKRLRRPTLEEGFDELFAVEIVEATRKFVLHHI